MGTLFKRPGHGPNWYCQYVGADGRRVRPRSTKTTDKTTAKRILSKWEADAALRRGGVIDLRDERISKESTVPIKTHIVKFQASIESPGNSEKHINETIKIIKTVAARSDWQSLTDITTDDAESYSAELRRLGRANRTIQKHLAALKQFTKWCHQSGKLAIDPLVALKTPSPDTDRRLLRRALHPDEWPLLRDAARAAPVHACGITGTERALLYEVTIQTGLRANEIRELTPGKLHLNQSPPFILLPSRSTKNKSPARQYVGTDLRDRLVTHAKSRVPGTPLFDLPHETDVAEMARRDLAIARDAWIEAATTKAAKKQREKSDWLAATNHEGERFDFHALRHTCGSWLAMDGENPKTIQSIMRHSSITLTMDRYGHLFPASEADAIARLADRRF